MCAGQGVLWPDPKKDHPLTSGPPSGLEIKRVLFVCIENSNRSRIAKAFAHIHGQSKIKAYRAGSDPSGKINLSAIQSMAELGYNLSSHRSQSRDDIPPFEFATVVTMSCGDSYSAVIANKQEN